MNGESGVCCRSNDIDPDPFHRRPCSERMSARIGHLILHAAFTKNALPSRKAGGKTHPLFERCRLHHFDNMEELKLIGVMTFEIFF